MGELRTRIARTFGDLPVGFLTQYQQQDRLQAAGRFQADQTGSVGVLGVAHVVRRDANGNVQVSRCDAADWHPHGPCWLATTYSMPGDVMAGRL